MVNPYQDSGRSQNPTPQQPKETNRGTPLVLQNTNKGLEFAPRYSPETFRRAKERNVNRKDQFCEGENVTDQGSKNWDFHIVGRILTSEIDSFDEIVERGEELLLTSLSWSGETIVVEGELEGPVAWDPVQKEHQWKYTLDIVSTGRDELGGTSDEGILDAGTLGSGGGSGGLVR